MSVEQKTSLRQRVLLVVPVVHSAVDLGSHGESTDTAAQEFWLTVVKGIESSGLRALPMKVYQDGLPICNYVDRIVDDLAGAGSLNFRIIQYLRDAGAEIVGTEPGDLLVEEYQLQQQLRGSGRVGDESIRSLGEHLLRCRDEAIATRIGETLEANEIGLLFIGVVHHVEKYLPDDIALRYPFGRPGRREGGI